jgi:hypothetical protein
MNKSKINRRDRKKRRNNPEWEHSWIRVIENDGKTRQEFGDNGTKVNETD